jgi:GAF domain-containing protein
LKVQRVTVGVLFLHYQDRHAFSDREKKIVELLAAQAAAALANAQLIDLEHEQRQHAERLRQAAQVVNSAQSLDEAVSFILDELHETVSYTSASVQLLQGDRRIQVGGRGFRLQGASRELLRNVSDDPLIYGIIQRQAPLVLGDVNAEPLWGRQGAAKVKSWIGCPLIVNGQVIGLLTLDHRTRGHFTEKSGELVAEFASQVAAALWNSTQAQTLTRLNRLTQQLFQLEGSPREATESLLRQIADDALGILSADVIELYEYQAAQGRLIIPPISAGERRGVSVPRNEIRSDDVILRLIAEDRSLYIPHAQTHAFFRAPFIDRPADWPAERFVVREKIQSSAFVPLRTSRETLGFMFVSYRIPQAFTPERVELIELFANQAAVALTNARLLASLDRQLKGHRALGRLGSELLNQLDEESILDKVARSAADTIDCTHCSVLRVEGDQLVVRAAQGNRGWSLPKERSFKMGQGVAGWVAEVGEAKVISDTSLEPHFDTGWSNPQADPKSLIVAPLFLAGKVYGVISIEHDQVGAFDDQDKLLAETLASQASQAVRITHLLQRLATLNQVGRELSAKREPQSIYTEVAKAVVQTLDCTHCTVFVVEDNLLIPRASTGQGAGPAVTRQFAMGEGVAGQVAQEARSLLLRDAKKDKRFVVGQTQPNVDRSLVVVPIHGDAKVMGVISADQDRINAFDENDLQLIETLALQAAIALENVDLFHLLQEHARQLVQLQTETAHVVTESNTLANVLESITTGIAHVFGSFSCTIRLYDPATAQFAAPVASKGAENRHTQMPPRAEGTSQHVLRTKQPVYGPDALATLPGGEPIIRPENRAAGVEAVAYLPLLFGGELVGRLAVSWDKPRHFSELDKRVLELFASQAAANIQLGALHRQLAEKNAQLDYLLNRKIRDLHAVYEVSQRLTSAVRMSEQDVLQLIYEQASKLMKTENMYIALYDEVTENVRFPLMYSDGKAITVNARRAGKGRTEWIIKENERIIKARQKMDLAHKPAYIYIFNHTRAESEAWYRAPNREEYIGEVFASWLGVPMIADDRVLGVIATYHRSEDYAYTEDDREVLELMASQAAIVLQNARMWETMQNLSEDLSVGVWPDGE